LLTNVQVKVVIGFSPESMLAYMHTPARSVCVSSERLFHDYNFIEPKWQQTAEQYIRSLDRKYINTVHEIKQYSR